MGVKLNEKAVEAHIRRLRAARKGGLTSIDGVPGLNIIVKPSGTASYIIRYYTGTGAAKRKERKHVIGQYGVITLADAKVEALRIMRGRELGEDPIGAAKIEKRQNANALSLQQMWEKRLALDASLSKGSTDKYGVNLRRFVWGKLGDKLAREITADDVVEVLSEAEASSKHVASNVRAALSGLYRFGMQRRWVDRNPVTGLGFHARSTPRVRRISDDEIARLWAAYDSPDFVAHEGTKVALKLAVLLGQRPSELLQAKVDELVLDGHSPRYSPPAERMKRKSAADADRHIVPLSTQAVDLFRRAIELSRMAGDGVHVFPGHATGRAKKDRIGAHFSRHGLAAAIRRAQLIAGVSNIRNHDWRKALVTWLGEKRFDMEIRDRVLHHAPQGVTGNHYDYSILEGSLRDAFQRWADHVWVVTGQTKPVSNVVAIKQPA